MILGGLALAFSRVIDNSVISIENIYRHLEMGELPAMAAAEAGGVGSDARCVGSDFGGCSGFFPRSSALRCSEVSVFCAGVVFLFSLLASFLVAMTVIPSVLLAVPQGGPARRASISIKNMKSNPPRRPVFPGGTGSMPALTGDLIRSSTSMSTGYDGH